MRQQKAPSKYIKPHQRNNSVDGLITKPYSYCNKKNNGCTK
uniref:Uncharacterized protein n=1 Tax=Rhizophora mucronata TaxID=61149 RepID=A0A2P2LSN2_RHIMU